MAAPHAGIRKIDRISKDQTLLLQRARHNQRALEEKLQDLERDHEHLKEQHRELSLDYQYVLARLWHVNAMLGR